ncbi:MAG: histidine phosphatase family protein [Acidimicrobiales bacterium]|nr:histidine phosphatase family protein [Acidimicrobiales bacterium]MDG1877680.1 histidine phosphatase family protein [Acidimicrobiales bacterium]
MELIFVRHGRPVHIEDADGAADPPLADVGHEQAQRVADWLMTAGIDALYSSPMNRALQTAAPFADASGLAMNIRDYLREFDHEGSSYVPTEVLKATNPEAYRERISGGFVDKDFDVVGFQANVVGEVDRIVADHRGQRVAVVCHGGVINAYLGRCLEFAPDDYMKFDVDYSSISRVMVSSKLQRSIASVNERPHFVGRPHLAVRGN